MHEGVQLAPFYDLPSVATYNSIAFDKKGWPSQTQLAWPILGVRHFSDIAHGLLSEAGASLNLAEGTAEVADENTQIAQSRPKLAATMAEESRCFRAIVHTPFSRKWPSGW